MCETEDLRLEGTLSCYPTKRKFYLESYLGSSILTVEPQELCTLTCTYAHSLFIVHV